MTRSKKSRKPGVGSSGIRKTDIKEQKAEKEKRIRKKTGLPSGNRTQVSKKKSDSGTSTGNRDPRVGSKTPIVLGKADVKASQVNKPKASSKVKPLAKVRAVESSVDIHAEIEKIEQDALLLKIVEKQEMGQSLSADEVEHYNTLMERHEALTAQISEDESDNEVADKSLSEDDLWDKFNDIDINDFDEEDR